MGALKPQADPRGAVEQRLYELLPLDDERRAENEVGWPSPAGPWSTPGCAPFMRRSTRRFERPARGPSRSSAGPDAFAGLHLELEAERLHGLLDGLAFHTAMPPDRMSPQRIRSVLAHHLDSLDPGEHGG